MAVPNSTISPTNTLERPLKESTMLALTDCCKTWLTSCVLELCCLSAGALS